MKYEKTALRLREALNKKNMRSQDLANLSGVNKASISQYLNGSHAPSNISSGKMAQVLGVSAPWLMGYDVPMIEETPAAPSEDRASRLYEMYTKAAPEVQAAIDLLLKSHQSDSEHQAEEN